MEVFVCIGSSCHLKGSYEIIQKLQKLIAENSLEEKIDLNASFCLGHCTSGVTVKVGDTFLEGFCPANTEEMFRNHILTKLS